MSPRLLALALTLAISAPAVAQSEAYVMQAVETADVTSTLEGAGLEGFAALQTTLSGFEDGSRNVLLLTQSGERNEISAAQVGENNRVVLTQTGDRNAFVLVQRGDGNLVLATITGSDNGLVTVDQSNDDNVYALSMSGDNLPAHTVIQTGGGNLATQIVGPGSTPVDIQQTGNGIEVTVERN